MAYRTQTMVVKNSAIGKWVFVTNFHPKIRGKWSFDVIFWLF